MKPQVWAALRMDYSVTAVPEFPENSPRGMLMSLLLNFIVMTWNLSFSANSTLSPPPHTQIQTVFASTVSLLTAVMNGTI